MPKTEDAYNALRNAILECSLAPDAPLTVSLLKERFGFGWTPLREALSRLEAERLVVLAPNRGYRVCGVSAESLRDLQDARLAIEPRLFIRSIAEGNEDWEGRVVAAHHQLASTPVPVPNAARDAIHLWERRHDAFHAALLSGTQAPGCSSLPARSMTSSAATSGTCSALPRCAPVWMTTRKGGCGKPMKRRLALARTRS
ncbi:GntR family transcriptional regulator [Pannonibacter sp. Pt2-lr]